MSEFSIGQPQASTTSPRTTNAYGRPLIPRSFSQKSWAYYRMAIERHYRARIPGEPTIGQLEMIVGMANALFNAYKQDAEARRATGRESREAACAADKHRYTFTKLLEKFERSIAKAPEAAVPSLADKLRRGGAP